MVDPATGPPIGPGSRRRWLVWAIGLALLVVLGWGVAMYAEVRSLRARGLTFLADVFAWHPDGRVEQLTPGDGIYQRATVRPDGSRVVCEGGASGCVRLWRMDLATRAFDAITPGDSAAMHPAYSWDGQQIVFLSDRDTGQSPLRVEQLPKKGMYGDHRFDLFVMNAATRETRRIDVGPLRPWRPSFSPDGKTIVFSAKTSERGPHRGWTVPTDSRAEPQLLPYAGQVYNAWYAADGKSVFFRTLYEGRERACQLGIGEETPVPLANDRFERTHGGFVNPDGEALLVHAVHDGRWGMWELPLDGSPARRCQPPGLEQGMHGARARSGMLTFDVERVLSFRATVSWRLKRLFD